MWDASSIEETESEALVRMLFAPGAPLCLTLATWSLVVTTLTRVTAKITGFFFAVLIIPIARAPYAARWRVDTGGCGSLVEWVRPVIRVELKTGWEGVSVAQRWQVWPFRMGFERGLTGCRPGWRGPVRLSVIDGAGMPRRRGNLLWSRAGRGRRRNPVGKVF